MARYKSSPATKGTRLIERTERVLVEGVMRKGTSEPLRSTLTCARMRALIGRFPESHAKTAFFRSRRALWRRARAR